MNLDNRLVTNSQGNAIFRIFVRFLAVIIFTFSSFLISYFFLFWIILSNFPPLSILTPVYAEQWRKLLILPIVIALQIYVYTYLFLFSCHVIIEDRLKSITYIFARYSSYTLFLSFVIFVVTFGIVITNIIPKGEDTLSGYITEEFYLLGFYFSYLLFIFCTTFRIMLVKPDLNIRYTIDEMQNALKKSFYLITYITLSMFICFLIVLFTTQFYLNVFFFPVFAIYLFTISIFFRKQLIGSVALIKYIARVDIALLNTPEINEVLSKNTEEDPEYRELRYILKWRLGSPKS
jgi:hypothetical protein